VIAYAIRRLPYMLRTTSGSMQAVGNEVEEAAQNLGASRLVGLGTTVVPLLAPALLAGSILVFVTVIKETSITVLMAPTEWQPMSYAIFQSLHRGELGSGSALSVVLLVIVVTLQQLAYRFTPGGIGGDS
jgi:iron(III) transport system permease protein